MSDTIRMTGLYSGMDTESIISALVSAKSTKVDTLKNEQKKLEWKQTAWQDLNSKIYSFYSKTLSNMRLAGSYSKKTTTISDSTKASIIASDSAVNGTQTLKIKSVATTGYLTGKEITKSDGSSLSGDDKLATIDTSFNEAKSFSITVGSGDDAKTTEIKTDSSTTINSLITQLKSAGVNASFDTTNKRFFISSTSTGTAKDFSISGDTGVLDKLGINKDNGATKIAASDAKIVLNDAEFTSDTNTFSINGLTINVKGTTADNETLTITTDTDYDGIYDMIKDFISEYNDIINDIYQKYNADSARDYDMLTDDEKDTMTDDEIETWEDTIKASLLRKDSTLQTLMSSITSVMNDSYGTDPSTGKKRYLFTYGIETLGYFEAEEGERYALHIAGDPDDENTSSDDDLLKTALANDPDGTIDFFTSLCKKLYSTLNTAMTATDYSSIYKVYDDKRLQTEYDDYTTKISEAEDKLADYEDRWYSKFSSMETALSKLQSTSNTVSSMLGS
jgi:flagellar hook-associated protein 2